MNSSPGSYLPTILIPTRCNDASQSVSAFLKCLATRSLSASGLSGMSKQKLVAKRVSELNEVSLHLRNDIGMTQGELMAAQLSSVLEDEQSS